MGKPLRHSRDTLDKLPAVGVGEEDAVVVDAGLEDRDDLLTDAVIDGDLVRAPRSTIPSVSPGRGTARRC